jgi:predicted metal-binding membrane protein
MMTEATSLSYRFNCIFSSAFYAGISSERSSQRVFLTVSALLFAVSAAVTVVSCMSMSAMADMPMVGGWTMSMAWMRMPGQTWLRHAASFVGTWIAMMIAMMLPSLVPVLLKHRRSVAWVCQRRLDYLTRLLAIGYFSVWTIVGIALFGVGTALASFEMRTPIVAFEVPVAANLLVLIAGLLQFTSWKSRRLACCRELSRHDTPPPVDPHTAWRQGFRLGVHCSLCCAGLTAVLLVGGIMNFGVMAIIGAAITLERLAPAPRRIAQAIGAVMIVAALVLIGRTIAAV